MTAAARRTVLITSHVFDETLAFFSRAGIHVRCPNQGDPLGFLSREQLIKEIKNTDAAALMAFMPDAVDDRLLEACPSLEIVACALKGTDNFDIDAATTAGVWVSRCGDLLTVPTAELAVGLMIAAGRHFQEADRYIRDGKFAGWRAVYYGTGIADATIGLVGLGNIGQAIAARLLPFEPSQILFFDGEAEGIAGCERATDLPSLLEASDFVVLCCPLSDETYHLIAPLTLAHMQPHALLINPARGGLVDEEAVAQALQAGKLAGYAADVFNFEDWAKEQRPRTVPKALLSDELAPKTLFTPHLGSAVEEVRLEIELDTARNVAECLAGSPPHGAVNSPRE